MMVLSKVVVISTAVEVLAKPVKAVNSMWLICNRCDDCDSSDGVVVMSHTDDESIGNDGRSHVNGSGNLCVIGINNKEDISL